MGYIDAHLGITSYSLINIYLHIISRIGDFLLRPGPAEYDRSGAGRPVPTRATIQAGYYCSRLLVEVNHQLQTLGTL